MVFITYVESVLGRPSFGYQPGVALSGKSCPCCCTRDHQNPLRDRIDNEKGAMIQCLEIRIVNPNELGTLQFIFSLLTIKSNL